MLNNKTTSTLTIISTVAMMLLISTTSTKLSAQESNVKSSNTIDYSSERCYDNCIGIESIVYESILSKEIKQHKADTIKKNRLAEDARKAELARVEAIRISGILAENKRLTDIEAKKKRSIEIEKKRLVKLEKQREINRLAKLEKQKQPTIASRGTGYQGVNQDLGAFNVSWYGSNCTGCSGITAVGIPVKNTITHQGYGVAAADWSVLPPYSIIEVEGYGRYIVIDRGGAIKGKRLDLLTTSESKSNEYGRQQLKVTVLKWGKGN